MVDFRATGDFVQDGMVEDVPSHEVACQAGDTGP
jgi:hypothetical protein